MKCPTCGTENEPSAAFCDQCGASLSNAAPQIAPAPPQFTPPSPAPTASAGGITCPQCGTQALAGTMFCDNCGASLSSVAPGAGSAPAAPLFQPPAQPAPSFPPQNIPPAQIFPPVQPSYPPPPEMVGMPVTPCRLVIGGQPILAPLKKEVVLGRADLASGWNPDVDLTPYGGTPEAGVSRKHARFVWQGMWVIEDLNSTNGTFLRGQRLFPGTHTPVNNGEMFQIGKLQITFFAQ